MHTVTIDCDSVLLVLTGEEAEALGHDACRKVAIAMQTVADRHDMRVVVRCERVSARGRGENEDVWTRLAIDMVDAVRAEVGL
jgi:hypothetical protein